MTRWFIFLLLFAIVAGIFGFTGMASFAVGAAKIVLFVGIVLFLVAAVFGPFRG